MSSAEFKRFKIYTDEALALPLSKNGFAALCNLELIKLSILADCECTYQTPLWNKISQRFKAYEALGYYFNMDGYWAACEKAQAHLTSSDLHSVVFQMKTSKHSFKY